MADDQKAGRGRWRFLVPNAVTAANMMLGASAVFTIVAGHYETGGWLILLGVLLDKLDGTSARMLKASSAFGVEFDSLADLVTFGVAPATLVFAVVGGHIPFIATWGLVLLGISCGAYVLASAVRLARFNLDSQAGLHGIYFGFPMPLAASLVVTVLMVAMKYSGEGVYTTWALDRKFLWGWHPAQWFYQYFFVLVALVAAGMVSGLRVPKPKWHPNRMVINIYLIAITAAIYILAPIQALPEMMVFAAYQWAVVSVVNTLISAGRPMERASFMETISRPPVG